VKELAPAWANVHDRAEVDEAIHAQASNAAFRLFNRKLDKLPQGAGVTLITGPVAAGKTKLSAKAPADLTYEVNLSNFAKASEHIDNILKHGDKPHILYVYNTARGSAVRRAKRMMVDGRPVSISKSTPQHLELPQTIEKLAAKYGDKLKISIFDNSRHGEAPTQVPVANVERLKYTGSEDDLLREQQAELDRLHAEHHIPERVLKALSRRAAPADRGQGTPEPARSGGASEEGRPGRELQLEPGHVVELTYPELKLDPHRFQYKLGTDAEGVTAVLKDAKTFNPDLAGVITGWRDPANGEIYVVNGHHRYELAKRTDYQGKLAVRLLSVATSEEARPVGALQNIAEGRGTPIDAAKFLRDSGLTPEDLKSRGISMGESTAAQGVALSKLDHAIFNQVVQGDLQVGRAVAIGEASDDHAEQKAILDLVKASEAKGKRVNNETLRELVRFVKGTGKTTETTSSLFGEEEVTRSLALEKAEISAYVKQQLAKDKRLFGFVAKEGRAAELERAGNKIDVAKNKEISTGAAQAEEVYNKLSGYAGPVANALESSAQRLANGDNPNVVKQEAYRDIRAEISKTLGAVEGARPEGSQEVAGRGADQAQPEANHPVDKPDLYQPFYKSGGNVFESHDGGQELDQKFLKATSKSFKHAEIERLPDAYEAMVRQPSQPKAEPHIIDTPWKGVTPEQRVADAKRAKEIFARKRQKTVGPPTLRGEQTNLFRPDPRFPLRNETEMVNAFIDQALERDPDLKAAVIRDLRNSPLSQSDKVDDSTIKWTLAGLFENWADGYKQGWSPDVVERVLGKIAPEDLARYQDEREGSNPPLYRKGAGGREAEASLAGEMEFSIEKPAGDLPHYIRVNNYGRAVLSRVVGFRFMGAALSPDNIPGIASKLRTMAEQVSRTSKDGSRRLMNLADALEETAEKNDGAGVPVVSQYGNKPEELATLHEELFHAAVQMRPGAGDINKGVPHEAMATDPSLKKMRPRLMGEYGFLNQASLTAEAMFDVVSDNAPELSPEEQSAFAEKYWGGLADKHGVEYLRLAQAVDEFIAGEAKREGIIREENHGEPAARALIRVLRERSGAADQSAGSAVPKGPAAGEGNAPAATGSAAPDSEARVPLPDSGQGGGIQEDTAEAEEHPRSDLARGPQRGDLDWGGSGISDEQLDAFAKSPSLTIEEAGEQASLFGPPEKVFRMSHTGPDGQVEHTLVPESKMAAWVRAGNGRVLKALAKANQSDLFRPMPKEAIDKLISEDVKPALEKAGMNVGDIARFFAEAFFPRTEETSLVGRALKVGVPREAMDAMMEMKGDRDQLLAKFDLAAAGIEKMFDRMREIDRLDFIDRIMQGKRSRRRSSSRSPKSW
jgi:hypothetical protein